MKNRTRLTIIHKRLPMLLAGLFLVLLTGCADTKWPTWLSGEPGDDVLNAPRIVRAAPSRNVEGWPYLGNVPDKPNDYSPQKERLENIKDMISAKNEAEAIKQKVQSQPTPKPEPLPAIGAMP